MPEVRKTNERTPEASGPSAPTEEQLAEWQKSVKPADSSTSAWIDFMAETERKSADLCRSAATALIPVVALLFAGFVAFLRVSDVGLHGWRRDLAISALLIWAFAGAALGWFLLPSEWSAIAADGAGIKKAFLKFVNRRKRQLRFVGGLILVGVVCAVAFIATVPAVSPS